MSKTSLGGRPKSEILEELQGKSFAEEIENDKNKGAMLIGRVDTARKAQQAGKGVFGISDEMISQEQKSADVYKRALLMIGASGGEVIDAKGDTRSLADNGLPVSTYLSHGGRTMIEIPAGSGDSLMNWLTSGDKDIDGTSRQQTQDGAIAEDKIVYNRSAATHGISFKEENGELHAKEEKGFLIGARDFFANKILGQDTKHWGVDLAMNAEFGHRDSEGVMVSKPDGDHGHLYIFYEPPTKDRPGALLIGCEGGAPTSYKHSKTGASDPLSPVDSSKFRDLEPKLGIAGEEDYKDTKMPKGYGGIVASIKPEELDKIVELDASNYGPELASKMPARSVENFAKSDQHKTPELKPSKTTEPSIPKPSLLKRVVNKLTFGFAFKKEINAYSAEQKILKAQNKVQRQDTRRGVEIDSKEQAITPKNLEKTKEQSIAPRLRQTAITIGSEAQISGKPNRVGTDQQKASPPVVDKNTGHGR